MQKSYKIEIVQTEKYIVSVNAQNETQAKKKAIKAWNRIADDGMQHYAQDGNTTTTFGTVFDVTGTDDATN